MKLKNELKAALQNPNAQAENKSAKANSELSKSKKMPSKKNNLDEDERLNKEVSEQQTDATEVGNTIANDKDTVIASGDKLTVADSTTADTASAGAKSNATTTTSGSSGMSGYGLAGLIGLGAIGVAAAASSGGGGGGHNTPSGPAPDTSAPTLSTANRSSSAQTITLTFNENLDSANLPASTAFSMSLNGNPVFSAIPVGSTIAIGAANQLVITFPLGTFTAGDTIAIRYTDPTAGNDSNALQDVTGNDVASFTANSFSVIDGYVRNSAYLTSDSWGSVFLEQPPLI